MKGFLFAPDSRYLLHIGIGIAEMTKNFLVQEMAMQRLRLSAPAQSILRRRLASFNRRSEDVRILSVIVAELKFCDVERHIFGTHLVERAHHAALEDRPEALDCLCVNCTDDVLPFGMVNSRVRIFLVKFLVPLPLIGAEQADFVRNSFADKFTECVSADVLDNAGDHVALALHSADNGRFAGTDAARSTALATLVLVFVLRQSTDESFVNFDNAAKLVNVLHQRDADFVTHHPCSFQRTETHITPKLARADAFLGRQHEMNHAEPVSQRLIRVLKDRARNVREAITALWGALVALPMPGVALQFGGFGSATARAMDAFGPSFANKVSAASILIREHGLKLADGQLMDLLGLLGSGHNGSPSDDRRILPCPI